MRIIKPLGLIGLITLLLASCSSIKNMAVPVMDTAVPVVEKKVPLSEEAFNYWALSDMATDTIPGISLEKAYDFLAGKTGETVIVGVIDSGIDIEQEDLKDVVWMNTDEIPGNNIDDDKNGYVDDLYGWNFLGGNGDPAPEQLEITRLYAKYKAMFNGTSKADISEDQKSDYEKYLKYKKAYLASAEPHLRTMERLAQIEEHMNAVKKHLSKDSFTIEDLNGIKTNDPKFELKVKDVISLANRGFTEEAFQDYYQGQKKSKNYDLNFNGRAIVGDNPLDINDTNYGNGYVIGSKDDEFHGTHVSGTILAKRNNGIGMNGVANNAKLMAIRTVPDGDERDKDVALAIRYAADNGAKVVNMSFGKAFSPNTEWVYDAIQYASEKDVLLVMSSGNDGKNLDKKDTFPRDSRNRITEISDNVITVGSMSVNLNENLPASSSNYGKINVDIFAPGVRIYSTFPKNEYAKISGTSMASPHVSGVAALVRSYYPELSASQVKHILMNSAARYDIEVNEPGRTGNKVKFSELSVSGGVVNAYNALVLADKMVNGK
jgi:subtilisin family serine protease